MVPISTISRVKYNHTVGLVAMFGRGFSNPVDVAFSSDEKMYVLSRTNPDQPDGVRIGICDLNSEYYGDFGSFGNDDGAFVWPTALCFDSRDVLYLADEFNDRITSFDTAGRFLEKFGIPGTQNGQLRGPAGIAIDGDNNIYISDHMNHRIQIFDTKGNHIGGWGNFGKDDGQFDMPWGISVSNDGHLYVADWRNDRIQTFNSEGDFLRSYGDSGVHKGQFYRPSSVVADEQGYIYVADWGNERVQVLDPQGNFLLKIRGEATISEWAADFFVANPDEVEVRKIANLTPVLPPRFDTPYQISSQTEPYFWGPVSVKLDVEGRLYVTETNRHRFQVYQIN